MENKISFVDKHGLEDARPYLVQSQREVTRLLCAMQRRATDIHLLFEHSQESLTTSLLDVDEANEIVTLRRPYSPDERRIILTGGAVSFEATLDNIRIIFAADKLHEYLHKAHPALYIDMPQMLIRLQRRQFFRVPTPVGNRGQRTLTVPCCGQPRKNIIVALRDISLGGVMLIDEQGALSRTPGRVFKNCVLHLPGEKSVIVNLAVRNVREHVLRTGRPVHYIGCVFLGLPPSAEASLQRHIMKLEHARVKTEAADVN